MEFIADFAAPDLNSDPEKPPPLPEKKNKHSKQVPVFGFYFYLAFGRHQWVVMVVMLLLESECQKQPVSNRWKGKVSAVVGRE